MGDAMLYIILICLIIIGFLAFKLFQKQQIDKQNLELYQKDLKAAQDEFKQVLKDTSAAESKLQIAKKATDDEKSKLEEWKKELRSVQIAYDDIVNNRMQVLDEVIEEQRQKRQEELDKSLKVTQQLYEKLLQDTIDQCKLQDEAIKEASETKWREATEQIAQYNESIAAARERFEGIERVLRSYDAEQQAKLFYTIQLPEEYHEDIEFLLTTVAAKVQHPDIISKLVWAEYVKPNLDDAFKRIEIKPEAGIYKLTSLQNGKCYIGKSTNVKNRIADHFKSSIGIKSIADQAVHHAILKEGFWNWQIEVITYCDKDKLNELEKYYIEFFKTQEFGYNKTGGG